jgi:CRISPR-associated exonuclease Cas4
MTRLSDEDARRRALTDLGSTLLVEAAAGTGKTSLMAGRLAMLLASGAEPRNIAGITFTELAAAELSARVRRFVEELLAGRIPRDLALALPAGLDAEHGRALARAAAQLDELTTTTLHGFCQTIISGYAVEADMDPGARIMDSAETDAVFDAAFERWFKRRLGVRTTSSDPIAALSREDPRGILDTLRDLARFRRRHRTARPLPPDLDPSADCELCSTVDDFRRWIARVQAEPKTAAYVEQLEVLAAFYRGVFGPSPDFPRLWQLAHPPRVNIMRAKSFDFIDYRRKSAWERVAGKSHGPNLNDEALRLYEAATAAFRTLLGRIATSLIATLSAELDEVLEEFDHFKRAAAVLDFDDLLEKARALLRGHDTVRRSLAERYQYLLIDEFQDTDPIQVEIVFRLAAEGDCPPRWQDMRLRPRALFAVGDPKQAIYQFRGANVGSYLEAKASIEKCFPGNVLQVTASFRSRPEILSHVNRCFEAPLNASGQPGYVALAPTIDPADHGLPCPAKITIALPPDPRAEEIRETEATAVADLCLRLLGNIRVRKRDGSRGPVVPGDIALLAPTGTELWRYERALEDRGIPIASQAGKGLFRRQEIQDLIALTRVLADSRDTLAFGALLRGPLVGLTEEELLDIISALPTDGEAIPRFSVRTDPEIIFHPIAREVVSSLQHLRRKANSTSPTLLLAEAVEQLQIRPILAARGGRSSSRALANVDAFLEQTRLYDVAGLKELVRKLHADWSSVASHEEGRADPEGDAVEIITMHSAKGLEWPVVIPINTATRPRSRPPFVHRQSDNTLHWVLGEVVPPELADALRSDEEAIARERIRLWYVACTRAMELLIVPYLTTTPDRSWSRMIDLRQGDLPEFPLSRLPVKPFSRPPDPPNAQTSDVFEAEIAQVRAASPNIRWRRPTDHDRDRLPALPVAAIETSDTPEVVTAPGTGMLRGLVLHKLMEEILTGELTEGFPEIEERAAALIDELWRAEEQEKSQRPDATELARTMLRTLALPEIAPLRSTLVPEYPIYTSTPEFLLAGRADAIAYEDGRPVTVVDWKSDIDPTPDDRRAYVGQIRDYIAAVGAERGVIVYMSRGELQWVARG